MPQCQMPSCSKEASGKYKHCAKCYFSKIRGRKRSRQQPSGFFRMIVHANCSTYDQKEDIAISIKSCGVCNSDTEVDSTIQFVTVCVECAEDKNSSSLIAMSESTYDDFCKICKKVIPKTMTKPVAEKEKKIEQPLPSELTLSQMTTDLNRVMNGVVRIRRTTLLDRLMKECEYTMKQASVTVSSMLATGSYIEDDGMISLQKNTS